MRARNLISLGNVGVFAALVATGTAMFLAPHDDWTAALHTSLALLFVLFVALHIGKNGRAIRGYLRPRSSRKSSSPNPQAWYRRIVSKEFAGCIVAFTAVAVVAVEQVKPVWDFYGWGISLRHGARGLKLNATNRQQVDLTSVNQGILLEIVGDKGKAFEWPVFAVWAENGDGSNFQTLYVSRLIGTSIDESGNEVRRPQALPVWSHRYGHIDDKGLFLPEVSDPRLDAVSGATPSDGFALRTTYATSVRQFEVYIEFNQGFDWNEYFPEDGFPHDPEYAGGNGQPSLVYRARIDTDAVNPVFPMRLVGFGHYGGKRGAIYTDLKRITTAREILIAPRVELLTTK